jgi:hypothetical protein
MAIAVGTRVRLLKPYNLQEGADDCVVGAVQFVTEDGEFSDEETSVVQYVMAGGPLDGFAFGSQYVESIE